MVEEAQPEWKHLWGALPYTISFLSFLMVHELGHYFMARYYKIDVTLPTFMPGWLGFLEAPSIGTFGAVIRIKGFIKSRKEYFDIGTSRMTLAGFIIAVSVLIYGFTHLPEPDFIYEVHPEYAAFQGDFKDYVFEDESGVKLRLGYNLLFSLLEDTFADSDKMPNAYEVIHYPILFAGYLGLLFTALNLLPIGQLDGGHVIFGLFGRHRHKPISIALFIALLFYSGLGIVSPYHAVEELIFSIPLYTGFLYICFHTTGWRKSNKLLAAVSIVLGQYLISQFWPHAAGYQGWLLYGFLIGRVLGVGHPPALFDEPLSKRRKLLGWVCLVIFILCFSPQPLVIDL